MNENKILVVDDEEMIRDICERMLTREKYIVDTIGTGDGALKLLEVQHYDLVLLDLRLGTVSGLNVLKEIKKTNPDTAVIIMTGQATISVAVETVREGAYDFLTKPFTMEELSISVSKCLESQKLHSELHDVKEILALHEIAQAVNELIDLDELLLKILKIAKNILVTDSCSLMLLNDKTKELEVKAQLDLEIDLTTPVKIKSGERIAGWVWQTQQPLIIQNGTLPQQIKGKIKNRPEIKSSMVVPLRVKNKIIGILNLNRTQMDKPFTPHDLQLAEIFATNTTTAIINVLAYERLKEVDRSKTNFIANVSHEFRTPLAALSGGLELVLNLLGAEVSHNPQLNKLLDVCQTNVHRIASLVAQIIEIARLESGQIYLHRTESDIMEVIRSVINSIDLLARQKQIKLELQETEGTKFMFDVDKIGQVLVNLISNAIKFTPTQGRIKVTLQVQNNNLVVTVEDDGIGIPVEHHEKIFDRFYQIDTSLTREVGGTGLGLAICRSIIEMHGGKIWVESPVSAEGKGSKFIFTLPRSLSR